MNRSYLKAIVLISFLAFCLPMVSAAGDGKGSFGAAMDPDIPDFSLCGTTNDTTLNPYCPLWDGEHSQPDPFLVYEVRKNTEEREYGISSLQPPPGWRGLPTKGTVRVPVFLVEFSDAPHDPSQTVTDVQSKMFGEGNSGDYPYESLKNYYQRSSYNQLTITGDVFGWYPAAHPRSYYLSLGASQGRIALINEILQAYDNQINFADYDADHNGKMDALFIKWAGSDNGWGNFWWACMSTDSTPITLDGVKPYKYVWSWYSKPNGGVYHPQVDIHETGHLLGLPDYYDYDDASGPKGGVGGWDMMDYNWGDHNAFSKYLLGWIDPVVISSGTQEIILPPSGTTSSENAVLVMPGAVPDSFGEFFLVQYRERGSGNDPLSGGPNRAVWIWHVDSTLTAGGWGFQYDNSYTSHKLLRLMEADGQEEIEAGNGDWDVNDFYLPGQALGPGTLPDTKAYTGSITNVAVTNIQQRTSSMKLDAGIQSAGMPAANFTGTPLLGPAPLEVTFTDTSAGSSISNRRWDFGDGNITDYTVSTNPFHHYTSAGTYTVNLTVTNASGSNSRIRTQYVTVTAVPVAPVAHFTANVTSGSAPLAVKFTDTSTGTPTAWNWSFRNVTGNNTQVWFSTLQNPARTFGAGNFSIVLDASNDAGQNVSIQSTFITVTSVTNVTAETGVYRRVRGFISRWITAPHGILQPIAISRGIMPQMTSLLPGTGMRMAGQRPGCTGPVPGSISRWITAAPGIHQPIVILPGIMPQMTSLLPETGMRMAGPRPGCTGPVQGFISRWITAAPGILLPIVISHGIMPQMTSLLPETGMRMDGQRQGCIAPVPGSISRWITAAPGILPPIVIFAWDNAVGDRPIAGDWNADGRAETGVYRPGAGFYLKMDNGNSWNPSTDRFLPWDNAVGDLPVAGNFA